MRILPASQRALLVEVDDLETAMRLHLAAAELPGVRESVPGARTVLLTYDPHRVSAARLAQALRALTLDTAPAHTPPEVTIPVRYDGEDLDEVAALLRLSRDEVVTRHLAARWQVAFVGFAPGFGYLVGDDPVFDIPRRSSPRTRVPAGAVALAGRFTGVYPRESPGGWQLIGHTETRLWDLDREPPALLAPGVPVRFTRAAPERIEVPEPAERTGDAPPARRHVEVVAAQLPVLVQDLGRPGHAGWGVSASGAADRTALRDANHAVGNDPAAAALEVIGETVLRFTGSGVVAVTGAVVDVHVIDHTGRERRVMHGIPFAVADGDEVHLGGPVQGLRSVVGIRGGVQVPSVLGSRATDTLAGLGPAALRPGDTAPLGDDAPHAVDPYPRVRHLPAAGDVVELDITLGPRDDWFTDAGLHALTAQEWQVTPRADRIGIRLHGEALERGVHGELPSEGAVTGAIQVPPDGQPVLFLADRPLTGGYPVIGALTDRGLDLAGQLAPGMRVRFRIVEKSCREMSSRRR